ncbi:hypothetical protein, partial [Escherichia coli]
FYLHDVAYSTLCLRELLLTQYFPQTSFLEKEKTKCSRIALINFSLHIGEISINNQNCSSGSSPDVIFPFLAMSKEEFWLSFRICQSNLI